MHIRAFLFILRTLLRAKQRVRRARSLCPQPETAERASERDALAAAPATHVVRASAFRNGGVMATRILRSSAAFSRMKGPRRNVASFKQGRPWLPSKIGLCIASPLLRTLVRSTPPPTARGESFMESLHSSSHLATAAVQYNEQKPAAEGNLCGGLAQGHFLFFRRAFPVTHPSLERATWLPRSMLVRGDLDAAATGPLVRAFSKRRDHRVCKTTCYTDVAHSPITRFISLFFFFFLLRSSGKKKTAWSGQRDLVHHPGARRKKALFEN